jgi:molybdopterin/thiamine biosynthesis adenylyltransferase
VADPSAIVGTECWAGKRLLIAGLGNIGSALVLQLTQLLADVGAELSLLRLIDRGFVSTGNLANQAYDRAEEVGRPKALAAADRVLAIHPHIAVEPLIADLDQAPLGSFEEIDLCFGCLDSLHARQTLVSERAWPLSAPVVDGGVDGGGELIGRVQTVVPGDACLECVWGDAHYRQIAQETPCHPLGRRAPQSTAAPQRLGAAVAGVMLAEAAALLAAGPGGFSREIVFDLETGRRFESRIRRAASCRYDHAVVRRRIPLGRPLEVATLADVIVAAQHGLAAMDDLQFEFPRGLLDWPPFGNRRWLRASDLLANSERGLVELQLSPLDRIRIRGGGGDAFLVLSDPRAIAEEVLR